MFSGRLWRLLPLICLQLAKDRVSPVHALAACADALVAHNPGSVPAPLLEEQSSLVAAAAHSSKFPAHGGKPGGRPTTAPCHRRRVRF